MISLLVQSQQNHVSVLHESFQGVLRFSYKIFSSGWESDWNECESDWRPSWHHNNNYPILVEFPTIEHQQKKQTISYRKTKDIDIDTLTADFKKMFEEISENQVNFETNYKTYDKCSREIVEKHSPLITKTVKPNKDPPWMDAEYKLNRRNLEKKSKKNQGLKGEYVKQFACQNGNQQARRIVLC